MQRRLRQGFSLLPSLNKKFECLGTQHTPPFTPSPSKPHPEAAEAVLGVLQAPVVSSLLPPTQ